MGQRDVDVKVRLSLVDRLGQRANKTKALVAGLSGSVGKLQSELAGVNKRRDTISTLSQLNKKAAEAKDKWSGAQLRMRDLSEEMKKAGKVTAAMKRRMAGARREAQEAKAVYEAKSQAMAELTRSTNIAAKSTRHLALAEKKAAKESERLQNKLQSRLRLQKKMSAGASRLKGVAAKGGSLAVSGLRAARLPLAAGLGLGGLGLKSLVSTATDFETLQARLETATGSKREAKKSMEWVERFTATTPFQLRETTDSYIKLRDRGLNPSNGLLKTLGNTASAQGKSLDQVTEAMLDAMTGENERLKDLGITSSVRGNRTRFTYFDRQGKEQFKIVDKNNQKMIQSTLAAIWNEKYAGQMDKTSSTFAGMWSNLLDEFDGFKRKVMSGGLFDYLKGRLRGVLDSIHEMHESGELEKWAKNAGKSIQDAIEGSIKAASDLKSVFLEVKEIVEGIGSVYREVKGAFQFGRNYTPDVAAARTKRFAEDLFGLDLLDDKTRDYLKLLDAENAVPKAAVGAVPGSEVNGKIEVSLRIDSEGRPYAAQVTTDNPMLSFYSALLNGSLMPS